MSRRAAPQKRPAPGLHVEYAGCWTVIVRASGQVECIYEPDSELRLWIVHEQGEKPALDVIGTDSWSRGDPYLRAEELGQGYRIRLEGPGLEGLTVSLPERPPWQLVLRSRSNLIPEEKDELDGVDKRALDLEKRAIAQDFSATKDTKAFVRELISRGYVARAAKVGQGVAFRMTWSAERPDLGQEILEYVDARLREHVPDFDRRVPSVRAWLSIYLAHTMARRGRLVRAADMYRQGVRLGVRTGDIDLQLDGIPSYANVLAKLGYFEAAAYWNAAGRDLARREADAENLSYILTLVAETSLELYESGQLHDDPRARLDEVVRIFEPGGALEAYRVPVETMMGLAEVALADGQPKAAMEQIDRLGRIPLTHDAQAKVQDLRLRALLVGEADAEELLEALRRLEELASDAVGPERRWRAKVMRGRVHEHVGQRGKAIEAYTEAEALLDRLLPLMALGIPGNFAAARRGDGTKRLVALLAAEGRVDDAICAVRRSRARVSRLALLHRWPDERWGGDLAMAIQRYQDARLAYEELVRSSTEGLAGPRYERARLEAAQKQQALERQTFEILSMRGSHLGQSRCEDLTPRKPGELLLVLLDDGDDLQVLVADDQGSSRPPLLAGYFGSEPRILDWEADHLLTPIDDQLARARRVRVLASGRTRSIPVHALPWSKTRGDDGREPLAMTVPVVYGLDLPAPPSATQPATPKALVLGDALAKDAEDEAKAVAKALRTANWNVVETTTRPTSQRDVRSVLGAVDHFHYAGHAYYAEVATVDPRRAGDDDDRLRRWPPYSGGAASEPSYIPLDRYERLTVPEILMMDHVPDTVALMGCATGVMDERMAFGGFSLATAFLAAGSRAVVASTTAVNGREAAILGRALYQELAPGTAADPGRWMTEALRSIRDDGLLDRRALASTLVSYRIFVP